MRRSSDDWKVSRRSFLALCLAGCSSISRDFVPQESGDADSRVWALLSDTHISAARDRTVRGACMAANLHRVIADVLSAAPDHVLFNGDLAFQRGECEDYAAFQELISPLRDQGMPVHLTLGNHDDRARLLDSLGVTPDAAVADKAVSSLLIDGMQWFFLDSLEQVNAMRGDLGILQRAWLAQQLDANTAPVVLCVHHNPERSPVGLKDTKEFLGLVVPRRRIKLVLFGHTHKFRVWQTDGLHFVNLPAVGYRFFNPKVSLGWLLARIGTDGMRFEFRGVCAEERDHGTQWNLPWRSNT